MWEQQTLLSEDRLVSPSLSQASEKDSRELPDSCSNTFERYVNSVHVGLSGRTSQERSQASGGEAYRQLLSEMDALGYGLAWRVLDAQFFGVAQRRERVFLVGSLGTMRCAEVLFERESLSWDHQSSRQKRQALTDEAQERFGEADHDSGCLNPGETQSRRVYPTSGVYPTLSTREKSGQSQESVFLCQTAHSQSTELGVGESDVMNTLDTTNNTAVAALDFKVKPVAFLYSQGAKARSLGISEISPTLKTDHNPVVAFASNQHDEVLEPETDGALPAQPGAKQQTYLCQMAQTGSNGKLVKQDDVMNTLDRTNSTAIAALDFNPTDARLRYAQDDVSQTLTARAGTGGDQVPLVQVQPLVFNPNAGINEKGGGFALSEDVTPTLKTDHNPVVAFASNQRDEVLEPETDGALPAQPGAKQQTYLCQMAQTGSNGKLVKQDDVMNTLDRTNSTAIAALDFNPTDARLRYAQDDVSQTLTARAGTGGDQVPLVQVQPLVFNPNAGINEKGGGFALSEDVTPTLKTDHNPAVAFASNQRDEVRELEVAGALAAQPGIKQQTYICRADGQTNAMTSVDMAPTLTSHAKKDPPLIYPAEDSTGEDEPVTLQIHGRKPGGGKGALIQRDMSATLSTHNTQTPITGVHEKRGLTVRRLTPRECERLQGFPDDYTDIPYRNKEHAPDGARYKALGNSMAVPVMRWIGERIHMVEEANKQTD